MKRTIEEGFPIIEINRLAVPERNAFKPIYQMHKWFARRASCVFRAILLGCLKPAGTDIMEEFYKDHTNDPDTNGKVILDPFMGGGTTVVEALRLGCKVIGIDLNPVAWFIVKTEVEPVDIEALKEALDRLAHHKVAWSEKSVKETLLEQYKTECPCCNKAGAGGWGSGIGKEGERHGDQELQGSRGLATGDGSSACIPMPLKATALPVAATTMVKMKEAKPTSSSEGLGRSKRRSGARLTTLAALLRTTASSSSE